MSEGILQTPFNMMIVGMTGCGKTHYFLNIEKEEIKDIVQKLKNNKYSRLEILLRSPYTHEVIIPPTATNF